MWLEALLVLLLTLIAWKILAKPSNYPPGPWGLPFIGHVPLKKKNFEEYLIELHNKTGNKGLVSWRMGKEHVVFILDCELIREAFTSKHFSDRPNNMRILGFVGGSNKGLVTSNGDQWQRNRRFALHHLRDLGMGKSSLVSTIQKETEELLKALEASAGEKPSLMPVYDIAVATLNVIWQLVARKRYTTDDQNLKIFLTLLGKVREQMNKITIIDFMPWLKYVTPSFIFDLFFDEGLVGEFRKQTIKFVKEDVEQHKRLMNDTENSCSEDSVQLNDNIPSTATFPDYITAYENELKKKNENGSKFSSEDLLISVTDLFGAGIETVASTLQWSFLYLASHPDVQQRLWAEVDQVLAKGTLAALDDRQILPYTEAVIDEILRHTKLQRLGVMHQAPVDTELKGYKIPKGAIVISATFWANVDPKYWDSPDKFKPERFLDSEGKFSQPKYFFPFGIGKRQCLGESLARMELLIFLSAIARNFKFSTPPGRSIDLEPLPSNFFSTPNMKQEIIMTRRSS